MLGLAYVLLEQQRPLLEGLDHRVRIGLGLALVRSLVLQMQARVAGRNHPDSGFEVNIRFDPA